jgi:hypothetical protein
MVLQAKQDSHPDGSATDPEKASQGDGMNDKTSRNNGTGTFTTRRENAGSKTMVVGDRVVMVPMKSTQALRNAAASAMRELRKKEAA